MKKKEALDLSQEKSKLVIDYIIQILSDNNKITGKMDFDIEKTNDGNMCAVYISVPSKDFNRCIHTGIMIEHSDVFYEQLLNDFLDTFLEHETMGISRYYTIKFDMGENFSGMNAVNVNESQIKLNFIFKGHRFDELSSNYNEKINEYTDKRENKNDISNSGFKM